MLLRLGELVALIIDVAIQPVLFGVLEIIDAINRRNRRSHN